MTLTDYRDYLYGKGRKPRTIREYSKQLRRLTGWAERQGLDPEALNGGQVRDWVEAEVLPTWASRKQARSALAHYFRMLGRTDRPWDSIPVPRPPRPRYTGLENADATTLARAARMVGGRAGTATLLIMYTAQRPSETAAMRWEGIGAHTIRWWREKTSEWHELPLHPALSLALEDFRPTWDDGFLFPGDKGRPHVAPQTVWEWVRGVGRLVDVEVTPRQLRETAGNRALEITGDVDAACELLGHRDPTIVRAHYTQTSKRRLEAAVASLDYS